MPDSWFTRVWSAARGAAQQVGEDFVLQRLPSASPPRPLVKDEEYVSIVVRSSRIVHTRKWTGSFYGAVHARSHYLHEDRGDVEFQTVISPKLMKDLDPGHLARVITIDKPALDPVPFRGGLSLELGLFSVKGSDLAEPYIDLLTSMAETAGVASVAQAVPFVAPFRKGLDLLFGNADQAELQIGLDRSWNEVETGTWLLIRVPKGDPELARLRVDPADYGIVRDDGTAYREAPYVVFSVEGSKRRDGWMTIPELKDAWDAIGAAAKAGRLNDAETLFATFVQVATWSPDLIPADAARLVARAKARLPQLQGEHAIAARSPGTHPLGDLATLDLYDDAPA